VAADEWDEWAMKNGVDMAWWNAFKDEHEGRSPVTRSLATAGGDPFYALQIELALNAWGDQFRATYGRPPTQADWEYNWYAVQGIDRNRGPFGPVTTNPWANLAQRPGGPSQPNANPRPTYRTP